MMSQNYDGSLQNNTPGFCGGWNVHVFGARKFRWQALAEAQDAYKKQLSAELCCSLVWIVLIVLERQGEKAGILSELDHQNFTAI